VRGKHLTMTHTGAGAWAGMPAMASSLSRRSKTLTWDSCSSRIRVELCVLVITVMGIMLADNASANIDRTSDTPEIRAISLRAQSYRI